MTRCQESSIALNVDSGRVAHENVLARPVGLVSNRRSAHPPLPQFSDRLNANAPPGLAPAAKPLRVSLADYAAGGQHV